MRFSRREVQNIPDELCHPVLVKKVQPRRKTITTEPIDFEQAKELVSINRVILIGSGIRL